MPKAQQTNRTPKPIPALLEGSFSTEIENRIAEMNNALAREGRLTNDPLAVALRSIRGALKEQGFSFERVVVTPPTATKRERTVETAAPAKAAKPAKAKPVETETAVAPTRKARAIKPEQIEELQVAGSVSEAAPYGLDEKGRPLAPYGIKNDGTPMKRRGRVAAVTPTMPEPKAAKALKAAAAPVAVEEVEVEEVEVEDVAPEAPAATETEDDLDELLSGL